MKNLILIFLLLFSSFTTFASADPDTLYVNNYKAVALFFPSPIKQAITGNNHFTFTYNREAPQYLGLLQGIDGKDGNLLVITVDGNVFSYIVKYSDDLKQLTYFISNVNANKTIFVLLLISYIQKENFKFVFYWSFIFKSSN